MQRYFNIFLLNLQDIFTYRSRSIVGFVVTVMNPLALLLFWRGAGKISGDFPQSYILSYYLVLIIVGSLLRTTVEDRVSEKDIYEGHLSQYLLKPFSYYWLKFFEEIPYQLLQGLYGLLIFITCLFFFSNIALSKDITTIFFAVIILSFAYILAFTFKMIVGLTAFWISETQAMYHVVDALIVIAAGYLLPFTVMPDLLANIVTMLPFAYMAYYPVIAFQGRLSPVELFTTLIMQLFWLVILGVLYKITWSRGLRKYTAIGQ